MASCLRSLRRASPLLGASPCRLQTPCSMASATVAAPAHKQRRFGRAAAAAAAGEAREQGSSVLPEDSHLLPSILSGLLAPYWDATPTAEATVGLLEQLYPEASLGFDHIAFRTFGVEGLGISSVAGLFRDFGYRERDELAFPAKKLRARWYSPPRPDLPRVFVSELKVEELSPAAQAVVRRYTSASGTPPQVLGRHGMLAALVGVQPWSTPTLEDFRMLTRESEYAAWVLVHGYAVNHTTVAVHRVKGHSGGLEALNALLQEHGVQLNEEGGAIKVSPDGGLLQSSTIADRVSYTFAGGDAELVPGSYIEFAERKVLPQFAGLKEDEVEERHRRDGFEVASADRIFESTTLAQ